LVELNAGPTERPVADGAGDKGRVLNNFAAEAEGFVGNGALAQGPRHVPAHAEVLQQPIDTIECTAVEVPCGDVVSDLLIEQASYVGVRSAVIDTDDGESVAIGGDTVAVAVNAHECAWPQIINRSRSQQDIALAGCC